VAGKALDIRFAVASHDLRIEVRERHAEVVPFAQDRQPGQARLEAFEAERLEHAALVRDGPSPLLIVVCVVPGIRSPPAAFRLGHTCTLTIPSTTRTGKVATVSTAGSGSARPVRMSMLAP